MARPTDYDPKFVDEIIEYFSQPPYTQETEQMKDALGWPVTDERGMPVMVPVGKPVPTDFVSFAGFAAKIGTHRETLLNWTKQHPEFFDAYKRAKELQEHFLVVNGMKELTPQAFTIFVSKNVLGYRDKQPDEVDTVINNNVGNQTDEQLKARFDEILAKAEAAKLETSGEGET